MKKFLLVLLVIGNLLMLNAQDIKVDNILDKYILAWNEHDIKKIDSFYADNVIWYDMGYDYTTKGKKDVTKAITNAFISNVDGMYWAKNGDVFVSGNTVTYEWVYGGTYNGKWEDKTIRNKKFEIKGLSTTTFNNNGKIIAHKDYYDLLGLEKQLGLIK